MESEHRDSERGERWFFRSSSFRSSSKSSSRSGIIPFFSNVEMARQTDAFIALSGGLHCPFQGFHCCPDGGEGSKGISRMIPHLKRLHLCSDERKSVLREAIKSDHRLFMTLEETLKVLGQWMCGRCMSIQAVSRACHHPGWSDSCY